MKAIISTVLALGILAATPAFADKHAGMAEGKSEMEARQSEMKGAKEQAEQSGMKYQEQKQHKMKEGKGKMEQEKHRVKEAKQVGMETGKGTAEDEGKPKEKKWWRFWE